MIFLRIRSVFIPTRSSSLLNPCQGPTSDKDTSHMQQEPTEDAYPCCCFLDLSYVTVNVDTFHGATRIRAFRTINIWTRASATIVPSLACIGSYIALSHVTIRRLTIFLVIEPIAYSTLGHLARTGSMKSLRPSMHQLLLFMSVSPTAKMPLLLQIVPFLAIRRSNVCFHLERFC